MPEVDAWWEQMACRDENPAIFEEPVTDTGISRRHIDRRWLEAPLAVCKRCPVRVQCLDQALNQPFEHNRQFQARLVIGGLTPDQFAELQFRKRRSA